MTTLAKEKFAVKGIEFGIPGKCIGLVNEDDHCYGIAHIKGETIDKRTAKELLEENLNGECEYDGVVSAVKFFAVYDMDCEKMDFTRAADRDDCGGDLYAEMGDVENYIGLDEENADGNYAYDVHPDIRYYSKDVLAYYWFDCHDDVAFYNYMLVCRMSNISTKDGTYSIFCEFILPQDTWKEELKYLLSQVTFNGRSIMDPNELK